MTASISGLPAELIAKLQCVACQGPVSASADALSLSCSRCGQTYPLKDGRFPDFLQEDDRAQLKQELEFWSAHFQGVVYEGESEAGYQKWVKSLGVKPGDEIIEIGCGSGALLSRLPGKLRVGLEPAENLLAPSSGFWGVLGTAAHLPFRDESFDVVYFKHSLHHCQDKDKAIAEAARITKRGGRLAIIEPNACHPQRRLISNPTGLFRKSKLFVSFIGPVETFQSAAAVLDLARQHDLHCDQLTFTQSDYNRLTLRQILQRIYAFVSKPILPNKYRFPDYLIVLSKAAGK